MQHRRTRFAPIGAYTLLAALLAAFLAAPAGAVGQEHGHEHSHEDDDETHEHTLHFSHPLVAESVSPDTKLRLDYGYRDLNGEETEYTVGVAAEYAFTPSVSVEAGIPYSLTDAAFGFTHVALKFANYAFQDAGVSLGYGIGFGLPTSGSSPDTHHGDEHGHEEGGHAHEAPYLSASRSSPPFVTPRFNGSGGVHGTLGKSHWQFEPFLNLGWKTGRWELVGFTTFGIPSGLDDSHDVGTELSWNASALFEAAPEVQALLELHGHSGLNGHPVGEDAVNVAPGLKLRPSGDSPLFVGIGASFPITDDRTADARALLSLFYHFSRH